MTDNEQILTEYMRNHYSDEQLAALLAHCEDGKLSYYSCCCFIGVATADHALKSTGDQSPLDSSHLERARCFVDGQAAEHAFYLLGKPFSLRDSSGNIDVPAGMKRADEQRCAKLLPLIRAELARRAELKQPQGELVPV